MVYNGFRYTDMTSYEQMEDYFKKWIMKMKPISAFTCHTGKKPQKVYSCKIFVVVIHNQMHNLRQNMLV